MLPCIFFLHLPLEQSQSGCPFFNVHVLLGPTQGDVRSQRSYDKSQLPPL